MKILINEEAWLTTIQNLKAGDYAIINEGLHAGVLLLKTTTQAVALKDGHEWVCDNMTRVRRLKPGDSFTVEL